MNVDLEKITITIFFLLALSLGLGTMFDHRISHEFPYGYGASDSFQHQTRAEWIKDEGNFRYEAPYISKGLEKTVGRYPPILYHLAVILAASSHIEVYDAILFLIGFFAVIGSLGFYFIVSTYHKNIALLCLPISILIYSFPPSLGFIYGHWPSLDRKSTRLNSSH